MDVSAIMSSRPVTVGLHATLSEAMQLMDDHDVRHLPVVDGDGLAGIVSDRDLLEAVGWLPHRPGTKRRGEPRVVQDVMHIDLSVIAPEDTVVTAAIELSLMGIGCLPVVQNDALLGIVTEIDLLGAYWRACRAGDLEGDVDPLVREHMTHEVRTVTRETPLTEAASLARSLGVRHLPVVEGTRVVGLLSDRDLRAARGSGDLETGTAGEVMSSSPVTIAPDANLSQATEYMVEHRISALPVVSEERLVGILSLRDVLEHTMNTLREPETFELD